MSCFPGNMNIKDGGIKKGRPSMNILPEGDDVEGDVQIGGEDVDKNKDTKQKKKEEVEEFGESIKEIEKEINNNTKEAEIFDLKSNPLLGIKKKNKYQQNVIRLKDTPEVILYTGGVNESFDKGSKIYGVKGLINTICEFKKSKKSNLLEHIQSDIENFTTKLGKKNKLDDDLTIMHIKLNSTN